MKPTLLALALLLPLSVQAATDIQRWRNRDGTQILLVERHENPIIDLEVSFKGAGSVANPDGKSQVAEFTAALLTDGTQELDEEAFNAEADNIGAHISSDSNAESASAGFRSLSKADIRDKAANLLNHSLTRPRFDEAVFRRRQIQSITGLQQQETTPDYTATRELTKLIYPNHPYGSGANITVDSLKQVSLDDIRAFHRTHYGKDNAIVAIVGDLNRKQAEQLVERVLKDLPTKATATHAIPPVPKQTAQRRDIPFAGTQAQVLLGTSLIKRHDPDYYALVAGNYILGGGGFDSRLMKVLRDQHGYTYGVYSSLAPATEEGTFAVSYSTQKKNTKASLADTQAVIEQFIAEGPTEAELKQAKANIGAARAAFFPSSTT